MAKSFVFQTKAMGSNPITCIISLSYKFIILNKVVDSIFIYSYD